MSHERGGRARKELAGLLRRAHFIKRSEMRSQRPQQESGLDQVPESASRDR